MIRITIDHARLTVDFAAPAGITAIFGPSGAGKSTLLGIVAGLIPADATIFLDGEPLHTLPAARRATALVFQEGLLFPHLSVEANLRYGLRRTRRPGISFEHATDLLELAPLLRRRPHTLSGGERQRVALGRALLAHPRLLLLDEPLAALDTPRRRAILPQLRAIQAATGVSILYVTHAADEVLALADTLVLLERGHQVAAGPLAALAARAWPGRDDAAGLLHGRVGATTTLTEIDCAGITLFAPPQPHPPGTAVRVAIPARETILSLDAPGRTSVNNVLPCTIVDLAADADGVLATLACGEHRLLARVTQAAAQRLALAPGLAVHALVKSMALQIL